MSRNEVLMRPKTGKNAEYILGSPWQACNDHLYACKEHTGSPIAALIIVNAYDSLLLLLPSPLSLSH